jgi:hypothetical protein
VLSYVNVLMDLRVSVTLHTRESIHVCIYVRYIWIFMYVFTYMYVIM